MTTSTAVRPDSLGLLTAYANSLRADGISDTDLDVGLREVVGDVDRDRLEEMVVAAVLLVTAPRCTVCSRPTGNGRPECDPCVLAEEDLWKSRTR